MLQKFSRFPHLSAVAAMGIWGISYIWMKQLFQHLEPASILVIRLLISGFFLMVLLLILKRMEKIAYRHIPLFLMSAFFNPFLYFMGESHGLQLVSPTISAVIIATIPVFTPLFARIFLSEQLSRLNVAGIGISFAGVIIMLVDGNFSLAASPWGVAYLFGAVASSIVYGILLKKLTKLYSPITIVWIQNMIGILYFIPVALLKEHESIAAFTFTAEFALPVLLLGIFSSSLAFVFFTHSVKSLGIAKANIYTNLIPVFTAIFSILVLRETPLPQQWMGMLLVISGVAMSQKIATQPRKLVAETKSRQD